MNILKAKDRALLQQRIPSMPDYVERFIGYKLPDLSPATLLEYIRDYEAFFGWLIAEGLSSARTIQGVTLAELEALRMDSVDAYRSYLATHDTRLNSRTTITRKLSSLRSLFHYLSQIAEDDNLYPLLKRNVMAKVSIKRTHKPKDTAAKLEGKLLQDHELEEFLSFIEHEYAESIAGNKQALHAYQLNRVRDTCIISLVLHSGLRVSEVVGLNVEDLDLKKRAVYTYRKGKNDDSFKSIVYFRQAAVRLLETYVQLRDMQYRAPRREKALFLAVANGKKEGSRMTKRAIQEMVIKYARRYGKPALSVHKLRHSFATDYYMRNDLYKTQEQLGHASPETTQIYAHLTDRTMKEAIDKERETP